MNEEIIEREKIVKDIMVALLNKNYNPNKALEDAVNIEKDMRKMIAGGYTYDYSKDRPI